MPDYFYQKSLTSRLATRMWRFKWISLCFGCAAYLFASSGYIQAKAILAQYLIEDAWHQTQQQGQHVAPWSWADTYPVAELKIADKTLFVLSGASGRVLAFGPGHMLQTPLPGQSGNSVISGHRDTHFALLKYVQLGEVIETVTQSGIYRYQVTETRIVHENQIDLIDSDQRSLLTLITCYPFDGLTPNPTLRYVVRAKLI